MWAKSEAGGLIRPYPTTLPTEVSEKKRYFRFRMCGWLRLLVKPPANIAVVIMYEMYETDWHSCEDGFPSRVKAEPVKVVRG